MRVLNVEQSELPTEYANITELEVVHSTIFFIFLNMPPHDMQLL